MKNIMLSMAEDDNVYKKYKKILSILLYDSKEHTWENKKIKNFYTLKL